MFGPGLWPRRRSADVGLFPVLPRAELADAEPDCRDACPGQRYPWWSYIPGNPTRSTEAVRGGRRPPPRRRDRVRLCAMEDEKARHLPAEFAGKYWRYRVNEVACNELLERPFYPRDVRSVCSL